MTTLKDVKEEVASNTADITKIPDEFDGKITSATIKADKYKTKCVYIGMQLRDINKKFSDKSETFEQKYTPTQTTQLLNNLELLGKNPDTEMEEFVSEIWRFRKSTKESVKGNPRWYPVKILEE